jgi:glucose-1-phosphate cytidylyltransferase
VLDLDESGDRALGFREKEREDGGWINGGFMVMEPEVFDYLSDDEDCILERSPMETLAHQGKLGVYKHQGFWQCMDTQRDKGLLEQLWSSGSAPWKIWEEPEPLPVVHHRSAGNSNSVLLQFDPNRSLRRSGL